MGGNTKVLCTAKLTHPKGLRVGEYLGTRGVATIVQFAANYSVTREKVRGNL
jgi:hypothetical protein